MKATTTPALIRRVHRPQVTAAAAVPGATLAIERAAHGAAGDTLKLALVGCGGRGSGAANQAMNTGGVKLVALAEVDEDQMLSSLSNLRKMHHDMVDVPPERQFLGFDAYKKAIGTADVVILATPPGFRPQMFEEAVRQGKHVFMEKPVASDVRGIRRVLESAKEARRKNLKVGVGLQRRHQPAYEETIKRIHDGALGDLLELRCYWDGNARAGKERNPGETELQYQIRNWYYFTWLSGDHIVEQHVHNIDVASWIKGEYPVRAQGMGGRQVRNLKINGQIFDHHFVEYEYADGTRCYSQCRQIRGCWPSVSEHARGTKGVAELGNNRVYQITGENPWTLRLKQREDGHQLEHFPFFKAIRENEPYHEAEHGARSTMMAILGRMATYTGKVVSWDKAMASNFTLVPDDLEDWDSIPPVVPNAEGWYPVATPGQEPLPY